MPTTALSQSQDALTLQDWMAAFRETNEKIQRSQAKTDEQMRENREYQRITGELMRENREYQRKTDAQIAKTTKNLDRLEKNLGGLGNSLGMVIETLIAAKLWEKFDRLSYYFQRAYQRVPIYDTGRHALTEIDILLDDDKYVMAVEVKTQLDKKDDVDHHLKRMERILKWPPDQCKGKTLLGAIAGGAVSPDVRDYAHSVGFYVLELTGDTVALADPPPDFKPREW